MAGIVLLACGLFFGCKTVKNGGLSENGPNSEKGYETALTSANKSIREHPNNPDSYYYKGLILDKLAHSKTDPQRRQPIYAQMRTSLLRARDLYKTNGRQSSKDFQNIDHILSEDWSNAHNKGVGILKRDSSLSKDSLQLALSYIQNAITIIPDSAISFRVEADIYYHLGDLDRSIQATKTAMSNDTSDSDEYLQRLAFLYMENQQYDNAISSYKELLQYHPGDVNSLKGLTNAYLGLGDHQNAASVLQDLSQRDEKNPQYHLAYGVQLFNISQNYLDSLTVIQKTIADSTADTVYKGLPDSVLTDSANIVEETANNYINNAESQLLAAQKLDSTDTSTLYSLGSFYEDTAAKLIVIKEYLTSPGKVEEYDGRIRDLLQKSLPYLEQVVQNEPSKKKYWKALYKIYRYLDMKDKADQALSKLQS